MPCRDIFFARWLLPSLLFPSERPPQEATQTSAIPQSTLSPAARWLLPILCSNFRNSAIYAPPVVRWLLPSLAPVSLFKRATAAGSHPNFRASTIYAVPRRAVAASDLEILQSTLSPAARWLLPIFCWLLVDSVILIPNVPDTISIFTHFGVPQTQIGLDSPPNFVDSPHAIDRAHEGARIGSVQPCTIPIDQGVGSTAVSRTVDGGRWVEESIHTMPFITNSCFPHIPRTMRLAVMTVLMSVPFPADVAGQVAEHTTLTQSPTSPQRVPLSGGTRRAPGETVVAESEVSIRGAGAHGVSAATAKIRTTGGILLVLGGLLLAVWLTRHARTGPVTLPTPVAEVLGQIPFPCRPPLHLLRLGSKLVLVATHGQQLQTLAEVTDPSEVAQLIDMCQTGQNSPSARRPAAHADLFQRLSNDMAMDGRNTR